MKYQIITSGHISGLTDLVGRELEDGWALQGGVCADTMPGRPDGFGVTTVFYQAVVKEEPKRERPKWLNDRLRI